MQTAALKNWFSTIGQSWLDSLKIFLPQNLKFFLLASLNAFIKALPLSIIFIALSPLTFLLLYPVAAIITSTAVKVMSFSQFVSLLMMALIPMIPFSLFFWGIGLAIRPSVNKKNIRYFYSYLSYLPYILLLFSIIMTLFTVYEFFYLQNQKFKTAVFSTFGYFFIIFIYFLFDQKSSVINMVLAIKRAFQLLFYNLPFMVVSYGALYICYSIMTKALNLISNLFHLSETNIVIFPVSMGINFLLTLFAYCLYSVFYTKRVHEQFELYF